MKPVWHVSPGAAFALVSHACDGTLRLVRHPLTRNDREALQAGRTVFKLEDCSYCHQTRLVTLSAGDAATPRYGSSRLGGD